jgi:spore coat protein CotH
VFDQEGVHSLALDVTPGALTAILANAKDVKLPRFWWPAKATLDGKVYAPVGVRNFGDGSQQGNPKKLNLRVKFDAFDKGVQGPDGLHNLRFKAGGTEPSFLREPLFYRLLDALKAPAPRWSFARVTLNGQPYGFYQVLEHPDHQKFAQLFGDGKGNNYDPLENCVGFNCPGGGSCKQVLKNYELVKGDGADLAAGLAAIDQAPDGAFQTAVGKYFAWDALLAVYAAEAVGADLDGLASAGFNFELAADPKTGLLYVIRGGADETFMHPYDLWQPWGPPNIVCPGRFDRFVQRAVAIPAVKAQLAEKMKKLQCGVLALEPALKWVDGYQARIEAELRADPKTQWPAGDTGGAMKELKSWLVDRSILMDKVLGPCP